VSVSTSGTGCSSSKISVSGKERAPQRNALWHGRRGAKRPSSVGQGDGQPCQAPPPRMPGPRPDDRAACPALGGSPPTPYRTGRKGARAGFEAPPCILSPRALPCRATYPTFDVRAAQGRPSRRTVLVSETEAVAGAAELDGSAEAAEPHGGALARARSAAALRGARQRAAM
jgi:hypothetical protein